MSFSKGGSPNEDTMLSCTRKAACLNPNAAEFVPGSFKLSSGSGTVVATQESHGINSSGKAVLDRSESSVSKYSDDEAHQYWRHQLPDDITPDFKIMGADDVSQGHENLSFSGLSLNDGAETSRFPTSIGSRYPINEWGELSPTHSFAEKSRHSVSSYGADPMHLNYLHSNTKSWDKQFVSGDHLLCSNSGHGFPNDIFSENPMMDGTMMDPVEFLASQFPGFASGSLAEVYLTNGCDLSLTVDMLSQLELQVDGSFSNSINSKALSAPNLGTLDFPALPMTDNPNGNVQENFSPYSDKESMMFKLNSSIPSRSSIDFASVVKKPPQNSIMWKDDRNHFSDANTGSNRSILASSYNGANGMGIYEKLQSRSSARAVPAWVETGDAVEKMYSEMRGEARDYARVRNAYFDQARQAYLIGNKALAKELSMKGQLHNMQMKAAHAKAQESIFRHRNPIGPEIQRNNGRGQEKLIDLHGLHVTEAIHVLKHELSVVRSVARSVEQRLAVYICVGTGHHTRGSRTPARLPGAVQRYLLEDEGLEFSEPQPGLLLVVVY